MKNYRKITLVMLMMSALAACAPKTTGSNPTANVTGTLPATSNPVTGGTGTVPGTGTGTGSTGAACDGVYRAGATQCYYSNIPTVMASGGAYGSTWWSSTQFIASTGNSPNQFSTDATFNVRIIPRSPVANAPSTFGRTCSPFLKYAKNVRVTLMLHQNGVSVGQTATLSSAIDSPSAVWHFRNLPVTTSPLVLEVVNVQSDSRCNGYGTLPSGGCTPAPVYYDIPVNGTTWPTECVGFDIQYSTDTTYDLPGPSAN